MTANFDSASRKRPVKLTLYENLVNEAKTMTDNLSGLVELLLADFVGREHRERLQKSSAVEKTVTAWNRFNSKVGSIADEYSSL